MKRTYRRHTEEFKRMIVQRAERESVHVVAGQFELAPSLIQLWRHKFSTGTPVTPKSSDRIYWTVDELKMIAAEWILLHVEHPFESPHVLADKAQRKVFAQNSSRLRLNVNLSAIKPLQAEIVKQWKEFLEKPAEPAPIIAPPEPQVITIEVPRKLTAEEMLATLDEPALEALLSAKRLMREARREELLWANAMQAGASNLPKPAAFKPNFELFHEGQNKSRRIAVVGLPANQHELVTEAVRMNGLNAVLRFPDGKDNSTMARCDYAIIVRDSPSNGSDGDRAIGQLGRDRVVLLPKEGGNHVTVLQQIRNLCSRAT